MAISDYSTSANSNTTISGINIAENCPPSGINDAIRQSMADIRNAYNDVPWINFGTGSSSPTYTYVSSNSFKISGSDVTGIYVTGRRVRAVGSSTGTIFGTIGTSTFSTDTIVNVVWDTGSLANELLFVSLGPQPQSYQSSQTTPRGVISGLTMSAPGGGQILSIAAGQATDANVAALMNLNAAFTKTLAAWSAGTGNGSLDTGALAVNTWYHEYLIRRPDSGVVDLLTSASSTNPTLPANYTQFRRIGSFKTDVSSNIIGFSQDGDNFYLITSVNNYNAVPGVTSAISVQTSGPLGIQTTSCLRVRLNASVSSGVALLLTNANESDQAATSSICSIVATSGQTCVGEFRVQTDFSSKIRVRVNDIGATVIINTYGWVDSRGR